MKCPDCEAGTRVVETRSADGGAAARRRRECAVCGRRYTTYERYDSGAFVRKREGDRQRFDRAKLQEALLRAAHKRPVAADQIERLIDRIERSIHDAGGELSSQRIGELCLAGLHELDAGAYMQFKGVFDPAISGAPGGGRSVRGQREDAELPAQAASRRGTDG